MQTQKKTFVKRGILHLAAVFAAFLMVMVITSSAQAHGGCPCGQVSKYHSDTRKEVCDCYKDRMDKHEEWFVDVFWKQYMEPALKGSAAQQSQGQATAAQAGAAVVDAQAVNDTRRDREVQMVQTARRYQGSEHSVCTPASIGQSITASQELARGAASNRTKARLKNAVGSTAGRSFNGPADDAFRRFEAAASVYCDPTGGGGVNADLGCSAPERTQNLDVSMQEIFQGRDLNGDGKIDASDFNHDYTINSAEEERAVEDFNTNIGMSRVFTNFRKDKINANKDRVIAIEAQKREYMARRSMAAHSIDSYQALFSPGTDAATQYIKGLYSEMGRDASLIPSSPSVYLQQKVFYHDYYSNPKLFVDYGGTSPENVQRQQAVALATINTQLWNLYNVLLRIDQNLAGNTMSSLDEGYYALQSQIADVNSR